MRYEVNDVLRFGQLQRILVVDLPPIPGTVHGTLGTYTFLDIIPCNTSVDGYGFHEYTKLGKPEVVYARDARAVVGRIFDRKKWVIVQRDSSTVHALLNGFDGEPLGNEDAEAEADEFFED